MKHMGGQGESANSAVLAFWQQPAPSASRKKRAEKLFHLFTEKKRSDGESKMLHFSTLNAARVQ